MKGSSPRTPAHSGSISTPRVSTLKELAHQLHEGNLRLTKEVSVRGLQVEPESVKPGDLYVALDGRHPGSIRAAVGRGAVAVVAERGPVQDPGVPVVLVPDVVRALGHLAARFHGQPGRGLRTCGVTGSFGKSSAAFLLNHALKGSGMVSASIDRHLGDAPAADSLQRDLRALRDLGHSACVIEAPSLDVIDGRFEGLELDCALLTNATPRHLDVHVSMEEYVDSMAELFRGLPSHAVAVVNRDEKLWDDFRDATRARVITYGLERGGDVRGRICRMDTQGTVIEVATPVGTVHLESPLVGRFHAQNLIAALTASLAMGADIDAACRALGEVNNIPGSLERLAVPAAFDVFVDGAENERALDSVLRTLRPMTQRRLIVVFGSPKNGAALRSLYSRVAERWADAMIVTGTPGSTQVDMGAISDLMLGMRSPRNALLEPDREKATCMALDFAKEGDTILIIGEKDGADARDTVRHWCLADLEAEASKL